MVTEDRQWGDPTKPGRVDRDGIEWWACDPYPTWYRWEDGKLHLRGAQAAVWGDTQWQEEKIEDPRVTAIFRYTDAHSVSDIEAIARAFRDYEAPWHDEPDQLSDHFHESEGYR